MVQTTSPTTNPAGSPRITEGTGGASYSRESFVADLKKVATKQTPEKPKTA